MKKKSPVGFIELIIISILLAATIVLVLYTSAFIDEYVRQENRPVDDIIEQTYVEPRHCEHIEMDQHWSYDMTICVTPRGWLFNNPAYLVAEDVDQDKIYTVVDSLRFEAIKDRFYRKEYDEMIYVGRGIDAGN